MNGAFLARLAFRYGIRHRGQTARAIVGLLIATAVLVAGLGMADTITAAVERGTLAQFGAVDVVVTGAVPFAPNRTAQLVSIPEAEVAHARAVPTLTVPGSVTAPDGAHAASNVILRGVDPSEASVLGPLRAADGTAVAEPQAGGIVLSDLLASSLHVAVGDRVTIRVPLIGAALEGQLRIHILNATVSGVAAQEGRSGYVGTATALLPLAIMQNATGAPGQVTQVLIHVDGDAQGVAAAMRDVLGGGGDRSFSVRADKATILEAAGSSQNVVLGFVLAMTSFTLIAAVLLAYALLSALVEERRAELGVMRAMGLTRGEVALTMTLEGLYYTLAAAVAGLVVGLVALVGVVALLAPRIPAQFHVYVATTVTPASLATALAIGVLVPLATLGVGAVRFARLDPSRAIRGIAEDPQGERRLGLAGAGALGLGGLLLLLLPFGTLAAWPILLAAVCIALVALGHPRLAALPLVAGAAWLVYTLYTFTFPTERGAYDPLYTLGRGLLLALGLVALAVASPRPYDALARGTRGQGAILVAARYLMAKRRAAGLTMAMIAIVVMVVTTTGTLFSLVAARQPDDLGGYQIEGTSPFPFDRLDPPLPANVSHDAMDVQLLPRLARAGLNVTTDGRPGGGFGSVWGITPGFARNVTLTFSQRDARYATDAEAWAAIAHGEALGAADMGRPHPERILNATPGAEVTLRAPDGTTRTYTFAGFVRTRELGLLLGATDADSMGLRTSRVILVRAAPGVDANDLAARMTAVYQDQGLSFQSFHAIHEAEVQAAQPLVLVIEAFLGVGLLVGLSSTGILASRAVHERRKEIGTLRALGFEPSQVRFAFLVESTLTTLLGTLIGVAVGLVVAGSIWYRTSTRAAVPFAPPWVTLALFAGALLLLSGVAALGPAIRASRLSPAIAVRHVE